MNYPNGQTVSETKKANSNFASGAKSIGSKIEKTADAAVSHGSSIADSVMSSVSALLPAKSTEEALEMLESTAKDVQSYLMTARDSASSFIKKYPFYAMLGAGLVGAAAVMLITPRKFSAPSTDLH